MRRIFRRWTPGALLLVMALWFFGNIQTPKPAKGSYDFNDFGQLPVLANGRIQPMDSLARNSLLQLRDKQMLNLEPWKEWYQNPKMIPATEWLANAMMNPAVADDWPVFRLDNPDVITLLKLPERDVEKHIDGQHYSWNQITASYQQLYGEYNRILTNSRPETRNAYENAVTKVYERIVLYAKLKNTVQPEDAQDWAPELEAYERLIPTALRAAQEQKTGQMFDTNSLELLNGYFNAFKVMISTEPPLVVPPQGTNGWQRMGDALLARLGPAGETPIDATLTDYARMSSALVNHKPDDFNEALRDYRSKLVSTQPKALAKGRAEQFFNQMEPFYNAMVIYVLAGLLAVFSWFNLSETLRRSAVWLTGLAFGIHTCGLIYRMALEGRPPVTNLYSSAIFIGWGAVILGMILEKFHKNGIGIVTADGVGFITLIIAHHLALEGDTMEMMRAVLDNNFWLSTHVVAVTTGYASTFVAGFLGMVYVILGLFTPSLTRKMSKTEASVYGTAAALLVKTKDVDSIIPTGLETSKQVSEAAQKGEMGKSLARMIYGIVCFATLFSFVGTVLGGIWADQSWGRFWGWDPKENGALIIVLWNALILHLRWGGMIRERGLAICAIGGNIVTSWSWFGVNMLGIGLHSYGFTQAAFTYLMLFVASQFGLIILGMLPLRMWKSFSTRNA